MKGRFRCSFLDADLVMGEGGGERRKRDDNKESDTKVKRGESKRGGWDAPRHKRRKRRRKRWRQQHDFPHAEREGHGDRIFPFKNGGS